MLYRRNGPFFLVRYECRESCGLLRGELVRAWVRRVARCRSWRVRFEASRLHPLADWKALTTASATTELGQPGPACDHSGGGNPSAR